VRTTLLLIAFDLAACAASMLGTWEMDSARSSFIGAVPPKSLTMRIEPHARGSVFTLDRIEADGRATSSSTILYLDSTPRNLQDFECSGTQSSRWLNEQTMEIRRACTSTDSIWLLRQSVQNSKELMVTIARKNRRGPSFEWRLVLKKR
jgi:hypothetical protein